MTQVGDASVAGTASFNPHAGLAVLRLSLLRKLAAHAKRGEGKA